MTKIFITNFKNLSGQIVKKCSFHSQITFFVIKIPTSFDGNLFLFKINPMFMI